MAGCEPLAEDRPVATPRVHLDRDEVFQPGASLFRPTHVEAGRILVVSISLHLSNKVIEPIFAHQAGIVLLQDELDPVLQILRR